MSVILKFNSDNKYQFADYLYVDDVLPIDLYRNSKYCFYRQFNQI